MSGKNAVYLALHNSEEARPIIEAIEADNPEAVIASFPAMIKIDAPGRLVVNRKAVSERIGRDWDVQEIHLHLISLSGNVEETDDEFTLEWKV